MLALLLPITFPALRLVPLLLGVMLVALRRNSLAWGVVLCSAALQEWVSIVPFGAHFVEAVVAILVATLAVRRLVSTSTWTQLGLACFVSLAAGQAAMYFWSLGLHTISPAAIIPPWVSFFYYVIRQVIIASAVTMMCWPFVRARWAPLLRLQYER